MGASENMSGAISTKRLGDGEKAARLSSHLLGRRKISQVEVGYVGVFLSLHCKGMPSVFATFASLTISWLDSWIYSSVFLRLFLLPRLWARNASRSDRRTRYSLLISIAISSPIANPLSHCFGMNSQLFSDFFHGEHFLCHGFNSNQRLEPILPYEDVQVKLCLFMAV